MWITVPITEADRARLAALARREMRDPRRQAARLLAEALRRELPGVAEPAEGRPTEEVPA